MHPKTFITILGFSAIAAAAPTPVPNPDPVPMPQDSDSDYPSYGSYALYATYGDYATDVEDSVQKRETPDAPESDLPEDIGEYSSYAPYASYGEYKRDVEGKREAAPEARGNLAATVAKRAADPTPQDSESDVPSYASYVPYSDYGTYAREVHEALDDLAAATAVMAKREAEFSKDKPILIPRGLFDFFRNVEGADAGPP